MEEGKENLSQPDPNRKFVEGDIVWVVGEEVALDRLISSEVRSCQNGTARS